MDQLREKIEGLNAKIQSLNARNANLVRLVRERLQNIIDNVGSINYGELQRNFDELMGNLATVPDIKDTPLENKIAEITRLVVLIRHQINTHEDIQSNNRQQDVDEYRRLLRATDAFDQMDGVTNTKEIEKLQKEIAGLKKTIADLVSKNTELNLQKSKLERKNAELSTHIEQNTQVRLLTTQNEKLHEQNNRLRKNLEECLHKSTDMNRAHEVIAEENARLKQQLKDVTNHNEELERNLGSIKDRLTKLDTRMCEDLKQENVRLKQELKECREEGLRRNTRSSSLDRPSPAPKPDTKLPTYIQLVEKIKSSEVPQIRTSKPPETPERGTRTPIRSDYNVRSTRRFEPTTGGKRTRKRR